LAESEGLHPLQPKACKYEGHQVRGYGSRCFQ
jgi:hypothetical protein